MTTFLSLKKALLSLVGYYLIDAAINHIAFVAFFFSKQNTIRCKCHSDDGVEGDDDDDDDDCQFTKTQSSSSSSSPSLSLIISTTS